MTRSVRLIGYEQALEMLLQGVAPLPREPVAVDDAAGRILAAELISPVSLPRFDNAAMDGYALRAGADGLAAGQLVEVEATLAAGQAPAPLAPAAACEIMTGAPLPAGADTVVPVEQVQVLDGAGVRPRIRLLQDLRADRNVRRTGEDVVAGEAVLAAGRHLDDGALMLLAALGMDTVPVVRRPRVAIIATGRELTGPGQPPAAACIHDSNSPYLARRLRAAGAEVVARLRVGDAPAEFQAALDRVLALAPDLVISTGAVSMGRYDFIPDALRARGAAIAFHGVRQRPGKPILHARLGEGPAYLGLPGNPVSAAVGMRFYVEPLLRRMLALPPERAPRLPLAEAAGKRAGLRAHLHARLCLHADGGLRVHVLPAQASFRLRPFLASHAWMVLPEAIEHAAAGEQVEVYGPGHLQPPAWEPAP